MGTIKTTNIETITGSGTLTLGQSGETISIPTNTTLGASGSTITIPSGCTITNNGTQTGFGGTNTPAFSAYSTPDRSIADNTATLVAINAENFDTDSTYDTSTYRFTPAVSGKYFLYFRFFYSTSFNSTIRGYIYKNGVEVAHIDFTHIQSDNGVMLTTIQSADADDYFQAYTYQNSGTSQNYVGGSQLNEFGGYRIIE
jgi:hypothetical protein